jgi:hypothetical protein
MNVGLVLSCVTLITLIVSIGCIIKIKTRRSMFYAGAALITFGLVCSAYAFMFVELIFPYGDGVVHNFRVTFLSNAYLIIAATGANLLSTSICEKDRNDRHN